MPFTTSSVIMQRSTFVCVGISYIIGLMNSSTIERSPRAPVSRSIAFLAMARSASSLNSRITSSSAKRYSYCFVSAFLGSVKICTKAFSSRLSSVTTTGRRPINSGIRPYFSKSCGIRLCKSSSFVLSSLLCTSAPKPITLCPMRF